MLTCHFFNLECFMIIAIDNLVRQACSRVLISGNHLVHFHIRYRVVDECCGVVCVREGRLVVVHVDHCDCDLQKGTIQGYGQ